MQFDPKPYYLQIAKHQLNPYEFSMLPEISNPFFLSYMINKKPKKNINQTPKILYRPIYNYMRFRVFVLLKRFKPFYGAWPIFPCFI